MPIYTFKNMNTNEIFDSYMTYDEKVVYLNDNPHILSQIVKPPSIGDAVRLGRIKTDEGFKDRLREIKKNNRGSTINV